MKHMAEHGGRHQGRPRWITDEVAEKPVRQPLTRRRIVMAALALVEDEGLGAVTMRRISAALDVTPMSLYNHVADKAELLDLMLDFVLGDVVRANAEDSGTWEERLRTWARRNHDLWRSHPMFAQVYVEGVTIGPYGLANIEWGLGILRRAGLSDQDSAASFFALWRYCLGSILVAPPKPVDPARRDGGSDGTAPDRIETYFCALPLAEIPNVAAAAAHLSGSTFAFGLELIISGIHERLEATATPPSGASRRKR